MKLSRLLRYAGLTLVAAALAVGAPERKPPSEFNTPEINARGRLLEETARAQLQEARAALASGNLQETEVVLGSMVKGEPRSAGWHRGMAGQLIHLATTTRTLERVETRQALLSKAESHLQEAFRKAEAPLQQAAAHVMLGSLYERHLGDLGKAREAYEQAAKLAPQFPPATENAERLRRAEAHYQKQRLVKGQQ